MAAKNRNRIKDLGADRLLEIAQRNLKKGNHRQALKDAKVCYRLAPTEEHRRFLEIAFIARAQELLRHGLREECRGVAEDLLALGVSEPSVSAGLPDLLISLGMFDRLPADQVLEESPAKQTRAVDCAVLRPHEVPASLVEIRAGAIRVREALEAIQQGRETEAIEKLTGIPRSSPLADWKLFVRGLGAYYRGDMAEMSLNWDRLDAQRYPAKIAAPLYVVAGAKRLDAEGSSVSSAVEHVERALGSDTTLRQLSQLQNNVARQDWNSALSSLRSARSALHRLDPQLLQRVAALLCSQFIHQGSIDRIQALSRIVDPPPLDPHWNRALALACEEAESKDDDDAKDYWQKYIVDLARLERLQPADRSLAQAMVWLRLAERCVGRADGLRDCPCGRDHADEVAADEQEALECFEYCLELAPRLARAYHALADAHLAAKRPAKAAAVYRRALKHLPEDLDALRFLVGHGLSHDEPLEALECARRARRLKPMDPEIVGLLWSAHLASARYFARAGRWEEGRAAFASADALCPQKRDELFVLVRRGTFEYKAGCVEAGRQWVEQALQSSPHPAAVWMAMAIEAIRYDLPQSDAWAYEKRWLDALRQRCNGQAAGTMCEFMTSQLKTQKAYKGRAEHVKSLLKYVRRCSRVPPASFPALLPDSMTDVEDPAAQRVSRP